MLAAVIDTDEKVAVPLAALAVLPVTVAEGAEVSVIEAVEVLRLPKVSSTCTVTADIVPPAVMLAG